jgi:hypothetical protein
MIICPACSHEHHPKTKTRSTPQHRRFFGMIKAAHQNWPERYEFQPRDVAELRKWLTAKAGFVHRTVIEPPPEIIAANPAAKKLAMLWMEQSVTAASRGHEHCWIRRHGENIVVFVPKSISFHEMGQQVFGLLNDEVSNVIESIVGLSGDELLERQSEVA